jgi:hypothetical protein
MSRGSRSELCQPGVDATGGSATIAARPTGNPLPGWRAPVAEATAGVGMKSAGEAKLRPGRRTKLTAKVYRYTSLWPLVASFGAGQAAGVAHVVLLVGEVPDEVVGPRDAGHQPEFARVATVTRVITPASASR